MFHGTSFDLLSTQTFRTHIDLLGDMTSLNTVRRVAIIGAGPCGLAAARYKNRHLL
jgi:NADPH-dependent 2,4-dienoyl-CoA reductase/sulfur reductase-like enzyme